VTVRLHGRVFVADDGVPPGKPAHARWEEQGEDGSVLLEEAPAGLSLEEAIAWGRERAKLVLVRLFGEWFFSAGVEDPPEGHPRWPPSPEALAAIEAEVRAAREHEERRRALQAEVDRLPYRRPPRLGSVEGRWSAYGSSLAPAGADGVVDAVVCQQPLRLWAVAPGRFASRTEDGEVREGALADLLAAAAGLPPDDEHVAGLAALAARELASG